VQRFARFLSRNELVALKRLCGSDVDRVHDGRGNRFGFRQSGGHQSFSGLAPLCHLLKESLQKLQPALRLREVGCVQLAGTPLPRHTNGMKTVVELDASNRIVLSRELRRAAGIPRRQRLVVSATPGRIVLEMENNASGRVIKRGKLKLWTGAVPSTSIEEAVDQSRHYTR
jgi:bifunctional DNA-binding transcriptional regulator/antitoxin component of YhaV-PrlF toxin-antitoxin module